MIERALDLDFRSEMEKEYVEAHQDGKGALGFIASHVSGFDRGAKAGEIRLLSSSLTPTAHRPLYVAVIRDWEDSEESGCWKLIAPFGPYGEPATRSELSFSERQPALQVLCLWNTHSVPVELLDRSWLVDRMTKAEMNDAWSVFRHSIAGIPLSSDLLERVGSPIRDLQDARHEYQHEEIAYMSRVAKLAMEAASAEEVTDDQEETGTVILTSVWEAYNAQKELMAAATTAESLVCDEFAVDGFALTIKFYLVPDRQLTTVTVFAPDGELSKDLDGTKIIGTGGVELGVVAAGVSTLRTAELKMGIVLVHPSGQTLVLKRIS